MNDRFNNPVIKITGIILLLVASLIGGIYYFITSNKIPQTEIPFTEIQPVVIREYGLPIDSFQVVRGKIKPGQSISELLQALNVSAKLIDKVVNSSDTVFDFRKIKTGRKYTAYNSKDSIHKLQYFVYEHTPAEYIIFNFNDTLVKKQEKEIITKELTASVLIKSSLWNAMEDNDINIGIAVQLSEIYAWTIDFFDLKENDSFKVIYEEKFVDTISMGVTRIIAASFNNRGKDYSAIPFEQNNVLEFYDQNGNSLKKAFLKAPLKFARITSKFTNARFHPVLKRYTTHFGIDYAAPVGTPIHTIGNGKIISAGANGGAGNMIKIKHSNSYETTYMHLSKIEKGIVSGKNVSQGDIIGYVGSTGLSTGPHLDFRIFRNGSPIDPLKMISPPAEPIKKSNKAAFDILKKRLIKQLDKLKT